MIHRRLFRLAEILPRSPMSMMKDHSEIRISIERKMRKIIMINSVVKIINRRSIRVTGMNSHQTITIKMMVRKMENTMRRTNMGMSRRISSLRLLYNLRKLMKWLLLLLLEDNKPIEIFSKGWTIPRLRINLKKISILRLITKKITHQKQISTSISSSIKNITQLHKPRDNLKYSLLPEVHQWHNQHCLLHHWLNRYRESLKLCPLVIYLTRFLRELVLTNREKNIQQTLRKMTRRLNLTKLWSRVTCKNWTKGSPTIETSWLKMRSSKRSLWMPSPIHQMIKCRSILRIFSRWLVSLTWGRANEFIVLQINI